MQERILFAGYITIKHSRFSEVLLLQRKVFDRNCFLFLKNDRDKCDKHCDHEEKPKCTAQTAAMMMVMPWRSHMKTKTRSWRMMRHAKTRSRSTTSAHTRSAMKSTGSSASWSKHKTSTPFSSSVLLYRKNFAKPFLFIDCLNLPAHPAYATIKAPNLFCIRRILWN